MRIVNEEPVPLIDRALSDIGDTLQNYSASRPRNRPPASAPRKLVAHTPSVSSDFTEGPKRLESVRTLLLVDDEENILRALRRLLRGDDYQILTATSVQEACFHLGQHAVQVIVSDQRMPDVTGTQFLSKVKAMYPNTVRILLSGYSDAATVSDAIKRGTISKFLTKPWDDADIREQIRDAFLAAELVSKQGCAGSVAQWTSHKKTPR